MLFEKVKEALGNLLVMEHCRSNVAIKKLQTITNGIGKCLWRSYRSKWLKIHFQDVSTGNIIERQTLRIKQLKEKTYNLSSSS